VAGRRDRGSGAAGEEVEGGASSAAVAAAGLELAGGAAAAVEGGFPESFRGASFSTSSEEEGAGFLPAFGGGEGGNERE